MAEDKKQSDDGWKGKTVHVQHVIPPGITTQYANHATVQHTAKGDFFISFFEIVPPVILGEESDVAKQFDQLTSVPATCVARFAVTEQIVAGLIGALIDNHQKFLSEKQKPSINEDSKSTKDNKKHAI